MLGRWISRITLLGDGSGAGAVVEGVIEDDCAVFIREAWGAVQLQTLADILRRRLAAEEPLPVVDFPSSADRFLDVGGRVFRVVVCAVAGSGSTIPASAAGVTSCIGARSISSIASIAFADFF